MPTMFVLLIRLVLTTTTMPTTVTGWLQPYPTASIKYKIKESYIGWRSFAMKGDSYCLLKRADARVAEIMRLI